jgi:hypothetical protein
MKSKFLGRTDIPKKEVCQHCALPCKNEVYSVTHSFSSTKGVTTKFCSIECLREEMGVEEYIASEVEARAKTEAEAVTSEKVEEEVAGRVRKEFNFLHKLVCPSCRRRIRAATEKGL